MLIFNVRDGYGYIRPDDGGEDVYFDSRDAEGPITSGQRVEFEDKPQADARPAARSSRRAQ